MLVDGLSHQLCIVNYEFLIIRPWLQNNRYRGTVIKTGHGWQSSETIGYRGLLIKSEMMDIPDRWIIPSIMHYAL